MKASEMKVVDSMDKFRTKSNISIRKLAEALGVDDSSLSKQLKEIRGGIQLNTAYRIAEMLGGRIVFIPDAEWDRLQKASTEPATDQCDKHTAELQAQMIQAQKEIIERLQARVDRLDQRLDLRDTMLREKDQIIERKDAWIREHLPGSKK